MLEVNSYICHWFVSELVSLKVESHNLLMERHDGVTPVNIAQMLNTMASKSQRKTLDKSFVKLLLNLAGSECAHVFGMLWWNRDLSTKQARKQYGFQNMKERSLHVELAIEQVEEIQETVDYLAKIQDEALLTSFGIRDDPQSESDRVKVKMI